jgi:hypothetical protein
MKRIRANNSRDLSELMAKLKHIRVISDAENGMASFDLDSTSFGGGGGTISSG